MLLLIQDYKQLHIFNTSFSCAWTTQQFASRVGSVGETRY